MKTIITKGLIAPLAAIAALAVSGCGATKVNEPQLGVSTLKQLSTVPQRLTHDVRLNRNGSIDQAEAIALRDFLTAVRAGYGDDISIENPSQIVGAASTIAPIVGRFGLALVSQQQPTGAALDRNSVRVVVSRSLVQLPACPDWSTSSTGNFGNASLSNLGCASRTNLGLMIADPADLMRGRPLDGIDAQTITRGIAWQRDSKSKGFDGLVAESTTGK